MLSSFNAIPDYSLNQSENRFNTINSYRSFSKYFGNSGVRENSVAVDDDNKSELTGVLAKKNKDKESGKTDTNNNPINVSDKSSGPDAQTVNLLGYNDGEDGSFEFVYDGKSSIVPNSFEVLAAVVGASGNKITKGQLIAYLQSLVSEGGKLTINNEKSEEITFVKNLIAKFDMLSDGQDYITSLDGVDDPQEYTTITTAQVTSPVDVRVI